ncbi:hypothetical protein chiPu_0025746, partial [Chiloscyllium punctatum]|nr:hypothetical protein [Chiloscyllium punctatum]
EGTTTSNPDCKTTNTRLERNCGGACTPEQRSGQDPIRLSAKIKGISSVAARSLLIQTAATVKNKLLAPVNEEGIPIKTFSDSGENVEIAPIRDV